MNQKQERRHCCILMNQVKMRLVQKVLPRKPTCTEQTVYDLRKLFVLERLEMLHLYLKKRETPTNSPKITWEVEVHKIYWLSLLRFHRNIHELLDFIIQALYTANVEWLEDLLIMDRITNHFFSNEDDNSQR